MLETMCPMRRTGVYRIQLPTRRRDMESAASNKGEKENALRQRNVAFNFCNQHSDSRSIVHLGFGSTSTSSPFGTATTGTTGGGFGSSGGGLFGSGGGTFISLSSSNNNNSTAKQQLILSTPWKERPGLHCVGSLSRWLWFPLENRQLNITTSIRDNHHYR